MWPDWNVMDRATAATIAQIVPVLLLSLLFEARLRPRSKRSAFGLLLGFIGNLSVAIGAILLEFGLLGTAQNQNGSRNASWMWTLLAILFAVVLLRWAASTTAMKIAASSGVIREVWGTATQSLTGATTAIGVVSQILAAPSEVIARGIEFFVQAVAMGMAQVLGSVVRGVEGFARLVASALRRK